jgi:hypothetical protein
VLSFTSRLSLFPIHVFLSAATIAYDIFLTAVVFACPTSSSSCSPCHIYIYMVERKVYWIINLLKITKNLLYLKY